MGALVVRCAWGGWLQCTRGSEDRSHDHRAEGGLVGAGRAGSFRLVKQREVLVEAITVGIPS